MLATPVWSSGDSRLRCLSSEAALPKEAPFSECLTVIVSFSV